MTTQTGLLTSYANTEPIKRAVTDRIIMTEPNDIVAINALGLDNASKFAFVNMPHYKYEWLLDTYAPLSTTVNDATSLTSATTATQFTVTSGAMFQIGDVILLDSEYMLVTGVSSNVLTVTRGFGGTQATHANSITVYLVGRARVDGAAAGDSASVEVSTGYNFSAILQKTINIARTNALLPRYGMSGVVEREIDKGMQDLIRILSRMPYHGVRAGGSSTTPHSAGGLDTFISTNPTSASSAQLTYTLIENELQQCWDAGGTPDLILTSAYQKRKLADMFGAYVRTERDEQRGGITISKILSSLGFELDVAVDRYCQADRMYFLDRNYVGYITIDPFFEESLGKVGDTEYYGQIVGEYGFVVAYEAAHSYLYSLATS